MRDVNIIDSELRLLAAVRHTAAELGGPPELPGYFAKRT